MSKYVFYDWSNIKQYARGTYQHVQLSKQEGGAGPIQWGCKICKKNKNYSLVWLGHILVILNILLFLLLIWQMASRPIHVTLFISSFQVIPCWMSCSLTVSDSCCRHNYYIIWPHLAVTYVMVIWNKQLIFYFYYYMTKYHTHSWDIHFQLNSDSESDELDSDELESDEQLSHAAHSNALPRQVVARDRSSTSSSDSDDGSRGDGLVSGSHSVQPVPSTSSDPGDGSRGGRRTRRCVAGLGVLRGRGAGRAVGRGAGRGAGRGRGQGRGVGVGQLILPPGWSKSASVNPPAVHQFAELSGPTTILPSTSTPLKFFEQIFGADFFEVFAVATNINATVVSPPRPDQAAGQYATSDATWKPTSAEEMRAFVAISMAMGINQSPEYKDAWSVDPIVQNGFISSVMPRTRYEKLSQYMHCYVAANEVAGDKLAKVRPIITLCGQSFARCFVPSQRVVGLLKDGGCVKSYWKYKNWKSQKICAICTFWTTIWMQEHVLGCDK